MARRKAGKGDQTSPQSSSGVKQHKIEKTVLMETGKWACLVAMVLYSSFQFFVYANSMSPNGVCSYQNEFTYSDSGKQVLHHIFYIRELQR